MAGRTPKLNWTPSLEQWTATIRAKFYRLGTDQEQAKAEFERLVSRDRGERAVESNPLLTDCARLWLLWVKEKHTPERFRNVKSIWEELINFMGVGTRVKDLKPSHIADWLAPKNLKPGSETIRKATILACLNYCAKPESRNGGGFILSNPLKSRLRLEQGGSRGGEAIWSEEVFKNFIKASHPSLAQVIKFLRWVGSRPNLVWKVESRHFNPLTNTLDVSDLYKDSGRKAVKRIWLNEQAQELVKRLGEQYPTGKIFRTKYGKNWEYRNLLHQFQEVRAKLNLPETITLYGLRHTFATNFIKEFPDKLEYLREMLGHKDLKMIRKHYGHLFDEHSAIHSVLKNLQMP